MKWEGWYCGMEYGQGTGRWGVDGSGDLGGKGAGQWVEGMGLTRYG
jgi:hypothetical protein